jgi:ABC-type uncharacterized transport system auxiliary subunit
LGRIALALGGVLLLTSCLSGGSPPPVITSYALDYEPPAVAERPGVEAVMAVGLVGATDALASTDMLYRTGPSRTNSYNYGRWVSAAADMVGSALVSDMQRSGLFTGVFSHRNRMAERFLLFGTLDEFLEVDDEATATARAALTVALLDTRPPEGGRQNLLFQRRYQAHTALAEKSADGLAAALSQSMRRLSLMIITDVYRELRTYLE